MVIFYRLENTVVCSLQLLAGIEKMPDRSLNAQLNKRWNPAYKGDEYVD